MVSIMVWIKYFVRSFLSLSPIVISVFTKAGARDYELRHSRLADEIQQDKISNLEMANRQMVHALLQGKEKHKQELKEAKKPHKFILECLNNASATGARAIDFITAEGLKEKYDSYCEACAIEPMKDTSLSGHGSKPRSDRQEDQDAANLD